ncbi:MAG: glycosyl transferase family 1, partial [Armatimonadota bacterium]
MSGEHKLNVPPRIARERFVEWRHFEALFDDVGIIQHAKFGVPDRSHGYCSDDNARAVVLCCNEWCLNRSPFVLPWLRKAISFLHHAYNSQNGRMRNFMGYDRQWLDKAGSEDAHGRCVWAAGVAAAYGPEFAAREVAFELFHLLLQKLDRFTSPRAWAFCLLGITAYLERYGGDLTVRKVGRGLALRLADRYEKTRGEDWRWFEAVLAYDNARLAEAILAASYWCGDERMSTIGLEALEWLFTVC